MTVGFPSCASPTTIIIAHQRWKHHLRHQNTKQLLLIWGIFQQLGFYQLTWNRLLFGPDFHHHPWIEDCSELPPYSGWIYMFSCSISPPSPVLWSKVRNSKSASYLSMAPYFDMDSDLQLNDSQHWLIMMRMDFWRLFSEVNLARMFWVWKAREGAKFPGLSVFSVQLLSNDAQSNAHYHHHHHGNSLSPSSSPSW